MFASVPLLSGGVYQQIVSQDFFPALSQTFISKAFNKVCDAINTLMNRLYAQMFFFCKGLAAPLIPYRGEGSSKKIVFVYNYLQSDLIGRSCKTYPLYFFTRNLFLKSSIPSDQQFRMPLHKSGFSMLIY